MVLPLARKSVVLTARSPFISKIQKIKNFLILFRWIFNANENNLRLYYIPPFKLVVRNAKMKSIN